MSPTRVKPGSLVPSLPQIARSQNKTPGIFSAIWRAYRVDKICFLAQTTEWRPLRRTFLNAIDNIGWTFKMEPDQKLRNFAPKQNDIGTYLSDAKKGMEHLWRGKSSVLTSWDLGHHYVQYCLVKRHVKNFQKYRARNSFEKPLNL